MIRKLHHNAYRCRDSEETRAFYEDFLGLPLVETLRIERDARPGARRTRCIPSTGSTTARTWPSSRRRTCPSSSSRSTTSICTSRWRSSVRCCSRCSPRARRAGVETRGVSDHGFIDSIYFRDPNGYVIELTAKMPGHDREMDPATNARARKARSLADLEAERRYRYHLTDPTARNASGVPRE